MNLREQAWDWLATAPGACQDPASLPDAGWRHAASLGTAGQCLRDAGLWSLDDRQAPALDERDWWFRTDWHVAAPNGREQLAFDGLATLAQVWLNGKALLDSDNMFRAHRVELRGALVPGRNTLLICCRSLAAELQRRRPRPAWRVPMLTQQQLRWYRTTLLGRTPGWSPPVPPVGAWRPIRYLDGDSAAFEFEALQARVEAGDGLVALRVRQIGGPAPKSLGLTLQGQGTQLQQPLTAAGPGQWQGEVRVPSAALWWPHTHGEPALYRLVLAGDDGMPLLTRHIGFRTLEIDQHDGDFQFRVNGLPVFCRGACWMPLDPVTLAAEPAALRAALVQARDAGMNMLRVPGSTVYEDEAFFDLCDELGLLVWQDLMFSNMDYPADEAFQQVVQQELAQQAPRWRGRPSLAILCGNSEASQQAAMWGAPRAAWSSALFHQHLPAWLASLMPEVAYWPSSAWGGDFPHQVNAGTTSYYGVGAYQRPLSDASHSRLHFATECLAFANIPDDAALRRMPSPVPVRATHGVWKERSSHDLTAGWDFNDIRDHYLARLFGVDPAGLRYEDHERYLHLGRATTAELMLQTFAQWRAAGSACRGALVWFLRDLWAGAGWGLLDDAGHPKSGFHALRRVLQPQALLLTDDGNNGLTAHLVNERASELRLRLQVQAWRGATQVDAGQVAVCVPARTTLAVPLARALDHFVDLNRSFRFGPAAHDCVVARATCDDGSALEPAYHWPVGMGLPRSPALGLRAEADQLADGRVQVTVRTDQPAIAVHFDAGSYRPSDEYFHLAPGCERTVTFTPTVGQATWYGTVSAVNASSPVSIANAARSA